MPTQEQKLQAELLGPVEKTSEEELSPYNCPTCRSGVIEIPPALMADVVNVEL